MKKIICFLLALTTLIFSSCAIKPKNHRQTADEAAEEMQTKIMECFINKDKETLKSVFCEYALVQSQRIDMEIDYAFDFIDGDIVSYDEPKSSATGSFEREAYGGRTLNIITDKGTEYSIGFKGWLTNDKEPDKVGVLLIGVHNETLRKNADDDSEEKFDVYIGNDD